MLRIPHLLVSLLAAGLCACGDEPAAQAGAEAPEDLGGLQIAHPAHPAHPGFVDLGPIPLGEVREQAVELINREGRPLTIESIQAGCSCTVPALSYVGPDGQRVTGNVHGEGDVITLPEGATAELLLRVDSRKSPVRNKPKLVTVRMVSDSDKNPFTTLEVRVLVESDFRAAPDAVELGRVPTHGGGVGATRVFSSSDLHRKLLGVLETPEGMEASLEPSIYLGEPAWDLEVRALPPVPLGYHAHEVLLSTTGPDGQGEGQPFAVEVRVTGVPDLEVRPARLLLRAPDEGQPLAGEVMLFAHIPGQRLLIEGTEIAGDMSDRLSVELVPERPDEIGASSRWTIRLKAQEDLGPEALNGTVTLRLRDEEVGDVEIPYLSLAQQP